MVWKDAGDNGYSRGCFKRYTSCTGNTVFCLNLLLLGTFYIAKESAIEIGVDAHPLGKDRSIS